MLSTLQKPTLRNHFGKILEGLSASSGRGMYEEKYTRTWETLLVPDSKGWNEVPVSLGRKNGIRRSSNSKIPALKVKVPPFYEPEMEHKHQRRTAQGKISGKLVQR